MRRLATTLVLIALALAGCAEQPGNGGGAGGGGGGAPSAMTTCLEQPALDPDAAWKAERPRVLLETTHGNITIALETERAPITASNFLNLTRDGFYDGVRFHRIVEGFVIQGGDPLTKDEANAGRWGTGGPGYSIPDEFHPELRHDRAGVLSMANSGPNTGGSQFFITLGETPHLDDRHSVFGEVVDGLDVVETIGNIPTNSNGRPMEDVIIQDARAIEPETFDLNHAVGLDAVVESKTTEAGRAATFTIIVKNDGSVRDAPHLMATAPEGWTCTADAHPVVPAGTARVVLVTVTPGEDWASETVTLELQATSAWTDTAQADEQVALHVGDLGEAVSQGDAVTANYAGILPDGRLFDTSMQSVAEDLTQPKFETLGGYRPRPAYDPFQFTVGQGVIPGFTNLALTAKEGETVAGRIPAQDAYATGDVYQRPLTGRDLVFELEIVSIN